MEKQLLELYNQFGINGYTFLFLLIGITFSYIYDLLFNISTYFSERTLYYLNKRKELKNGR